MAEFSEKMIWARHDLSPDTTLLSWEIIWNIDFRNFLILIYIGTNMKLVLGCAISFRVWHDCNMLQKQCKIIAYEKHVFL